ncbi:MAG: alpha/beta fold hydrolase, partial [Rhodobacteraceae bacterium]|nr:alpha/beta fold hydrolase [Paracoccaceae bacterium]
VGHSIAGLYGLAFASRYPAEVSGLLLDDARLPGFDAACIAAGVRGCKIPALLYALLPPSDRAELDGAADMLTQPARPERWAKIRMTLLVAGQPSPGLGRDFQDLWIAHATAFAAALPQAHLILVPGSGHYVHKDAPQAFDSALAALLAP